MFVFSPSMSPEIIIFVIGIVVIVLFMLHKMKRQKPLVRKLGLIDNDDQSQLKRAAELGLVSDSNSGTIIDRLSDVEERVRNLEGIIGVAGKNGQSNSPKQ